jgi:hypothetical protein
MLKFSLGKNILRLVSIKFCIVRVICMIFGVDVGFSSVVLRGALFEMWGGGGGVIFAIFVFSVYFTHASVYVVFLLRGCCGVLVLVLLVFTEMLWL